MKVGRLARSKGPLLDDATFENLRERITSGSGIHVPFDESSRYILERRLAPRLRVRGVTSFTDYERNLDENEMDAILDVVAVHETYFFREKKQLKVFADHIIPEILNGCGQARIWSAGCSTGEEAYTIAILLAEQGLLDGGRARVIASDLSPRVIDCGIRAIYGPSSFRTTEPVYKEQYVSEVGRGLWRASDSLRGSVHFERFNLVRLLNEGPSGAPPGEGSYDVIFCRNVLMYFDEGAIKNTLKSFYSLLSEGGYLLLGHAESLLPLGTGFRSIQFGRELVYRK